MKRVLYFGLAFLVFVLLAIPAAAQESERGKARHSKSTSSHPAAHRMLRHRSKPRHRSNKGGKVRGKERAEEVQQMNKKADANRGFTIAPGVEKAESKKHRKDHDADRDKDKDQSKHQGKHKGKHQGKDRQ